MKETPNNLVLIDLNVFAHFIRERIESRHQPLSTRYNTAAVHRAKKVLATVQEATNIFKGPGYTEFEGVRYDKVKPYLQARKLPTSVKEASAAVSRAKKLQSDEKSVIQACFVWLVSGEWLGPYRRDNTAIAFVGDLKCPWDKDGMPTTASDPSIAVASGYWRHYWLTRPDVYQTIPDKTKNARRHPGTKKPLAYMTEPLHYKAGRAFPSPALTRIRVALRELITAKGYPLLWSTGYEADDHAALMVRINELLPEQDQRELTLVTTDGDWVGMIGPSCTWFCMQGYAPRIRANVEDLNNWKAVGGVNGALSKLRKRYGAEYFPNGLEKPSDIFTMKAMIGDSSDALPPGSPIEVIDLRNPPAQYDLMSDYQAVAFAKAALATEANLLRDEAVVNKAADFLRHHAVMLPIRTYEPA